MHFVKRHWLIITILALALFVRLYRIEATMTFLEDEGRDLLVVKRMFDTGKPALLGPQTSTGNMYLGPAYYYFIAPALVLSGMNPLGPAILIAFSGLATVYFLYYLGKQWFGARTGYSAAILYALMPLPVAFTRNSWNPNLAPLVSLLIVWVVIRIMQKTGSYVKNYLALGALLGILVQLHYMTLLLVVAVGLSLIMYKWQDWQKLAIGSLLALAAATLSMAPFIVFEVRNNFVNTRAITRFVEAKEEHNIRYALPFGLWRDKVVASGTRLFASQFGRDALTPDPHRVMIAVVVSALLIWGVVKNRHDKKYRAVAILFLIPFALLGIYQENVHLHYLGFLFPLTYLLVAAAPASWLLSLALMVYAVPQTVSYLGSGDTHQLVRAEEVAAYISANAGDIPYNVTSAEGSPAAPYLYYLALASHPPTTEHVTKLFLICQGELCASEDINSPFIYITGPAHPTLELYLGHPLYNYFEGSRKIVLQEHVSHGTFVTMLEIEGPPQ